MKESGNFIIVFKSSLLMEDLKNLKRFKMSTYEKREKETSGELQLFKTQMQIKVRMQLHYNLSCRRGIEI